MTELEFLVSLASKATKAGGQAHLAKELGVSPAYISDVLNGRRLPGKSILSPLGLERVISYRKRNGK